MTLLRRLVPFGPLLAGAIGIVAAVVSLHTAGRAAGSGDSSPPDGSDPVDARQIYLRDCAFCHGAGLGGTADGPPLVDDGAAHVHYMLSTGRMPLDEPDDEPVRSEPSYDHETIDALVEYIASFGTGGEAVPDVDLTGADLAHGGALYRLHCAACHQWGGQGGVIVDGEVPPLQRSTPVQVAEAIRIGPGAMPAFGPHAVDDAEIADVAAYVEYLQDPIDPGGNPLWHFGPLPEGGLGLAAVLLLASGLALIGQRR